MQATGVLKHFASGTTEPIVAYVAVRDEGSGERFIIWQRPDGLIEMDLVTRVGPDAAAREDYALLSQCPDLSRRGRLRASSQPPITPGAAFSGRSRG
jgi:hypothetical protein